MKKIIGVIPARYASTRFPGKILARIHGKPMIVHVAEKVEAALGKENTLIATDDQLIADVVKSYGYQVIITSDQHKTGTDRLFEVSTKVDADVYVNIQGDEPVIDPKDILKIAQEKANNPDLIINGYSEVMDEGEIHSLNIPKVVFGEKQQLLYMSRFPIPGYKEEDKKPTYYKQVCIYAFNKEDLKVFGERNEKTTIEHSEDIEILRFHEMGFPIKMIHTKSFSLAVDVPEDILKVEKYLDSQK